jgi:hypothetical protein
VSESRPCLRISALKAARALDELADSEPDNPHSAVHREAAEVIRRLALKFPAQTPTLKVVS